MHFFLLLHPNSGIFQLLTDSFNTPDPGNVPRAGIVEKTGVLLDHGCPEQRKVVHSSVLQYSVASVAENVFR